MLSALACTINHMEQGLLILSSTRAVTMANKAAQVQLKLPVPLTGAQVTLVPMGDKLNDKNEYLLAAADKTVHILGELYVPDFADADYAKILAFTRTRDLRKKMYAMTAAVSSGTLVGSSPETIHLRAEIEKVARGSSTVLITGESGTGKEVAATAIWRASPRSNQQFVALNCAAIPESLLESELFGYVKGVFMGADPSGRVGKFELANNGVIFLDEIGDMPLFLQAKLLRVLQERKITRIGSNQLIPVDLRVIADGKFREDLYYRLNVIPMHIASLRARKEDIKDLAELFAQRYAACFGRRQCTIPPATMQALLEHPWYGNVRELENTVEFMVNMNEEDGQLSLDTLPRDFFAATKGVIHAQQVAKPCAHTDDEVLPLCEVERREIEKALHAFGESTEGKRKAARALGIGLATLYRKMDEFSN